VVLFTFSGVEGDCVERRVFGRLLRCTRRRDEQYGETKHESTKCAGALLSDRNHFVA
jgi:hypothetical protein